MRPLYLTLVGCCFCGSAQAFDSLIGGSVASTYVASQVTSAPFDNKLILASRDDAAVFVASHGTKRGPWLETALRWLHEQHPQIAASDLELAEAILVQ
ncbi:DUF2388 domain-containing protein [Stutzerimonas stutzeri]|uniref:DUF2388 domain-containing protein n=1 Tax=Stutzerimonas stutzeri TaxID=316 RepID=UPI000C9A0DAB|nr:DUF2388 domain-containing protein [Stutzerimonas stutzeri]PNG14453.1 Holliday junction resolvase [Stutzerimonas stutzeri]